MKHLLLMILFLIMLLIIQSSVNAELINKGFETGDLTGWEAIGDVSIQDSSFGTGPKKENYQVLLTTLYKDELLVSGPTSFSGVPAARSDDLDLFLFNDKDVNFSYDYPEGSVIKQTFTASAGDILSFNWNFLTDEYAGIDPISGGPDIQYSDLAFVIIDNEIIKLADAYSVLFDSSTLFDRETGFQTFSYEIQASGSYTLRLGVADETDFDVASALLVDDISVNPLSIPEPSIIFLIGSLMIVLVGVKKKLCIGSN